MSSFKLMIVLALIYTIILIFGKKKKNQKSIKQVINKFQILTTSLNKMKN